MPDQRVASAVVERGDKVGSGEFSWRGAGRLFFVQEEVSWKTVRSLFAFLFGPILKMKTPLIDYFPWRAMMMSGRSFL